jgi:hypothetical protein
MVIDISMKNVDVIILKKILDPTLSLNKCWCNYFQRKCWFNFLFKKYCNVF